MPRLRLSLVLAVGLALASLAPSSHALPQGFVKEVLGRVKFVHDLEFLPGTDLVLLTRRLGQILVADWTKTPLKPSKKVYLDLLDVTDSAGEKGLLDVVLDPDFKTNNYIYAYYCRNTLPGPGSAAGSACRISRFTHNPATKTADRASEFVLWVDVDGYPTPGTEFPYDRHYGAELSFGPNGLLYATLGDKGLPKLSQDLSTNHGCVIRITKTGLFPADNAGIAPARGCWVTGLRNGFRSSWDVFTGRFFVAEVGGNVNSVSTEDLHVVGVDSAGKNLGWPLCEGKCNSPDFPKCSCAKHDDPFYTYSHNGKGAAIVGGHVYRGSMFPAKEFLGAYFLGDYAQNWIKYLKFNAQGKVVKRVDFDVHNKPIGFSVSPVGALYLVDIKGDVIRYRYIDPSANQPPALSNFRTSVQGRTATISIKAVDPEKTALSYAWTFGDGATATTTGGSTTHTYQRLGLYRVFVAVTDKKGAVAFSTPIQLQVGVSPTATCTLSARQFQAGDGLVFSGSAKDARGKALTGASLVWNILLKHNDHTHPYATGIKGNKATIRITSTGHSWSSDTGLIFELTATDQFGLSATTSKLATPRKVDLTIQRIPCAGAITEVDGLFLTSGCGAPVVFDTMIGFKHELVTPPQLCLNGTAWQFAGWFASAGAEGLAQTGSSATYVVPGAATTLTAKYERDPQADCFGDRFLKYGNGLRVNLDAVDPAAMLVAGGLVQSWTDRTGGMSVAAPMHRSSQRPGVRDDLRALAGAAQSFVRFDGVNDVLESLSSEALPTNWQARTVYLVARFREPGAGGVSYGNPAAASPCRSAFNLGLRPSGALSLGTGCGTSTAAGGSVGRGWNVLAATVGSSSIELWVNGVQVGQAAKPAQQTASGPFRIGAWGAPLEHAAVDVAHIMVYQGRQGPGRIADASAYLAAKHLAGPEYMGCFPDQELARNLGVGPIFSPTESMTLEECVSTCQVMGMAFAGMQYSKECFCGTADEAPTGNADETGCTYPCQGDADSICGGFNFASIYRVPSPLQRVVERGEGVFLGCFKDKGTPRQLRVGPLFSPTDSQTPAECVGRCQSLGMSYASLQYGQECWCGTAEDVPRGSPNEVGCTYPCPGDATSICGGFFFASTYRVPAVPPTGLPLGCFKDQPNPRIMSVGPLRSPTKRMTPEECMTRCQGLAMAYAGLQAGSQCFCGSESEAPTGSPNWGGCTKPCEGDASRTCGGGWRSSVYRLPAIPSTGLLLGCFKDQPNPRIMSVGPLSSPTKRMTPEECMARCQLMGMAFAGLQAGSQCFCGSESEAPTGSPNWGGCRAPCEGDANAICGGGWRSSVYRLPPIPEAGLLVGCFKDQPNPRIMSRFLSRTGTSTPQECVRRCRALGMAFAGVQAGWACFCGAESEAPTGSPNWGGCRTPCEGDASAICGGGWRSSVYRVPAVPADGYLGCFADAPDEQLLSVGPLVSSTGSMTVAECLATCQSMGMAFAGLQYAQECWCGTAAEAPTKTPNEMGCTNPCQGDATSICGGLFFASVYSVPLARTGARFALSMAPGHGQGPSASPLLLGSAFGIVALVAIVAVVALRRRRRAQAAANRRSDWQMLSLSANSLVASTDSEGTATLITTNI